VRLEVVAFPDALHGGRRAAQVLGEREECITAQLLTLKRNLGKPVAVVRDMSDGIEAAVRRVFPGTYAITCHYHFLRAVGTKLFEPLYQWLRNKVDRRGVKKRLRSMHQSLKQGRRQDGETSLALELIEYIMAYKKEAGGLPYPFSLPAVPFYRRCDEVGVRVRRAILANARENRSSPVLSRLEDTLRLLKPPPAVLGRLHSDFLALEERWRWFERVRRCLRYRHGPVPLSTSVKLSERELEMGRRKIDWLLNKIDELERRAVNGHHARELRKSLRKVARLIREPQEELFAPNVSVRVKGRTVVRKLPRTNSPVEVDFRKVRRHSRRIRGNSDVEQQVRREGAGMLVAMNLTNREYVRVVYGSIDRIGESFSKVSSEAMTLAKSLMTHPGRL